MDRTQEEGSEEAGPYQETVRYEVMAPLERWLLYFFAAAAVAMAIYRIESHRSIRSQFSPGNSGTPLPSSSGWDSSSQNKPFLERKN